MLMVPQHYNVYQIPDFDKDENMQTLGSLFPAWPQWHWEQEEDLQLTEIELDTLKDPRYGHDARALRQEMACPCFLHSYSTVLRSCPCGCRSGAFHEHRLLRDGVRGFYVLSMITGHERWVHPREAALLCGLNPHMWLPNDLRAGLCLVGQCASPLQAAWMGAFLMDFINGTSGSPQTSNTLYKMWLLRLAHGMIPKKVDRPLSIKDAQEDTETVIHLTTMTKVADFLEAEKRLQGDGVVRTVQDLYGRLPNEYDITHGAVHGPLVLQHRLKRQRKDPEADRDHIDPQGQF